MVGLNVVGKGVARTVGDDDTGGDEEGIMVGDAVA